jgi:hypothetical protein
MARFAGESAAGSGLKPFDFVCFIFALIIIFFALIPLYGGAGDRRVITLKGGEKTWVFPQEAEETVTIPGPLGGTVVEIRGGQARVLSSPCQNQTCVSAGAIRAHGQWVACLPNKVLVSVEGGPGETSSQKGAEVDAAAW